MLDQAIPANMVVGISEEDDVMFIVRIFTNLLILCLELAAILGAAALGLYQPLAFAAVTFVLALVLGVRLEFARLRSELNF